MRPIDADVLEEILKDFESRYKKRLFRLSAKTVATVRQIVYAMKTVDAVEVVRCDKCRYRDPEGRHCDHPMSTSIPIPRKQDDFCSYGEKMDGDKNG
jgi:hypothetical protein